MPTPLNAYRKYWAECFGPAPELPMSRAEMFRYLIGRSAIPEEESLLKNLLDAQENETRQMVQQINRGWDM